MARKIKIPTTQEGFIGAYLRCINGILGLTDKELRIVESMIKLDDKVTATSEMKKQLVRTTGVKNVPSLTTIIKSLKDKGVLIKNPNGMGYVYNKIVVPSSTEVKIEFTITDKDV